MRPELLSVLGLLPVEARAGLRYQGLGREAGGA